MTHKTLDKRASQSFEEIQEMSPLEVIRGRRTQRRAGEIMQLLDDRAPETRDSLTRRERAQLKALRKARKLQRKARRRSRA